MIEPGNIVYVVILITVGLIVVLITKPGITVTMAGKMLAFVSLFVLPILSAVMGTSSHIEHSKTTVFCLSCHEMKPFGQSLHIDDGSYIPAGHYQNIRVPREAACFTCHTNYTLYGDFKAKMNGLHHVYVHYLGTPPEPKDIKLYAPYNNRECLHCHLGARTFEEGATHNEEPDRLPQIKANKLSCVSSGCHELVHNVGKLEGLKFVDENMK
jgi:cytochrome c-type protein NapC